MDISLQKRVESILSFVEESVKGTKDFTKNQAPEYITQLLRYSVVDTCLSFLWIAMISAVTVATQGYSFRNMFDKYESLNGLALVFGLSFLVEIAMVAWFACTVSETLKITIAPKVFLLEHVKKMITPAEKSND